MSNIRIFINPEFGLEEEKHKVVMSLPNFDAKIFFECTGIKVN